MLKNSAKSTIVLFLSSLFLLIPLSGNAAISSKNAGVMCDSIALSTHSISQAVIGLCHQIKSDAISKGLSYRSFTKTLKPQAKSQGKYRIISQYKNYFINAMQQNENLNSPEMTAGMSDKQICETMCANADATLKIPSMGWIIAGSLIGTANSKNCKPCSNFQPN